MENPLIRKLRLRQQLTAHRAVARSQRSYPLAFINPIPNPTLAPFHTLIIWVRTNAGDRIRLSRRLATQVLFHYRGPTLRARPFQCLIHRHYRRAYSCMACRHGRQTRESIGSREIEAKRRRRGHCQCQSVSSGSPSSRTVSILRQIPTDVRLGIVGRECRDYRTPQGRGRGRSRLRGSCGR